MCPLAKSVRQRSEDGFGQMSAGNYPVNTQWKDLASRPFPLRPRDVCSPVWLLVCSPWRDLSTLLSQVLISEPQKLLEGRCCFKPL